MPFIYTFNPFSVYNKALKAVFIYSLVCDQIKKGASAETPPVIIANIISITRKALLWIYQLY